jgi:hypothetical protein
LLDTDFEAGRKTYIALSNTSLGSRDIKAVSGVVVGNTIETHDDNTMVLVAMNGDKAIVVARSPSFSGSGREFRLAITQMLADSLGYSLRKRPEESTQPTTEAPKRRRRKRKMAKKKAKKRTIKKTVRKTIKRPKKKVTKKRRAKKKAK